MLDNYFVMEENSEYKKYADHVGYNQVGFDILVSGEHILFSLTFAWQPLQINDLAFNAPSGLTINGIVNSTHHQMNLPKMAP